MRLLPAADVRSFGDVIAIKGWGFFPAFFRSGVMTTPQWIQDRLGGKRIRMVIAVVSLVLYCFTKISATLYAGGIILKTLLGWDIYVSSAGRCQICHTPPLRSPRALPPTRWRTQLGCPPSPPLSPPSTSKKINRASLGIN